MFRAHSLMQGFNAFRFDGELESPTMACFVGHKAPALGFRV